MGTNFLEQQVVNGDLVSVGGSRQYPAIVDSVHEKYIYVVFLNSFNINKLASGKPVHRKAIYPLTWVKLDVNILNEEYLDMYNKIRNVVKIIE